MVTNTQETDVILRPHYEDFVLTVRPPLSGDETRQFLEFALKTIDPSLRNLAGQGTTEIYLSSGRQKAELVAEHLAGLLNSTREDIINYQVIYE